MHVGVPAEVKNNEFRVAMTPAGVHALVGRGHRVDIQAGAGVGAGYTDEEYREAGATIVGSAAEAWSAELVLKVKEPIAAGVRLPARGPHALHLPPPRGRPAAHARHPRLGRHRHRVRDGAAGRSVAAAPDSDERGRRPARAAGRRRIAARVDGRPRRAPRRRPRHRPREGRRDRRRRRRRAGRRHRARPRRRRDRVRHLPAEAARARCPLRPPHQDPRFLALRDRAPAEGRRPRRRRRARAGRRRAEGRDRRDGRRR